MLHYGKQTLDDDDRRAILDVLSSNFLTTGPKLQEFEKALCKKVGAKYSVAVSNGTAALHLISLAILKAGDKVLTTPLSFLATSNALLYVGAEPIFVDINSEGQLDLDLIEEMLKKDLSIKAISLVAFAGKLAQASRLKELKKKYKIIIIEDLCHALGATYENGSKAGSCSGSDVSVFSFHPVKAITTAEGGAITTNSLELYQKLCSLRNHGMCKDSTMKPWEYEMRELGYNYRLNDLSCALGLTQLQKLDVFIESRKKIAQYYDSLLDKSHVIKPLFKYDKTCAYHLYVVRLKLSFDKKEELFKKMQDKGIQLQVHYIPIPMQPFYQKIGYSMQNLSQTQYYYEEAVSLPIFPQLAKNEQSFIVQTLTDVIKELI